MYTAEPPATENPSQEKQNDVLYSGEIIEKMLFGEALSEPHYESASSRKKQKDDSPYEQYRSFLQVHASDPSLEKIIQNRNDVFVFKKPIALAQALGLYSETGLSFQKVPEKPPLPQFSKLIEMSLDMHHQKTYKDTPQKKYSFIPTLNTPLDFDYGTDAIIHTAQTTEDFRKLVNGEYPYISLGITCFDKKSHESRTGKTEIQSDVEIFVSNKKALVDRLSNAIQDKKIDPLVLKIILAVTRAITTSYQDKAEGKHTQSQWIDCTEIEREFEKTIHT
jgi:hypothetical protein